MEMKPIPTWQERKAAESDWPATDSEYMDFEIADLRKRCKEFEAASDVCGSGAGCLSKEARIDAAEERCAALEKDAARYQAIRTGLEVDPDNSGIVISLIDDFGGSTLHGEDADSAIDNAMASVPKGE